MGIFTETAKIPTRPRFLVRRERAGSSGVRRARLADHGFPDGYYLGVLALESGSPFDLFSWPFVSAHNSDTIPLEGSQEKMSHLSREKLDLLNRTKRVIGQLESVLRALNDDAACTDVLQRLAAARGAISSLMGELMEDHIRNHMPRKTKSSEEAADDLIEIVRTYLK